MSNRDGGIKKIKQSKGIVTVCVYVRVCLRGAPTVIKVHGWRRPLIWRYLSSVLNEVRELLDPYLEEDKFRQANSK